MFSFPLTALHLLITLLVTLRADAYSEDLNGSPHAYDNVVTRDIVIIGGGSTGTYSAIRLSDEGRSVVVVEQKARLGGHTETYHDPETGRTIDYGVIVFHDLPIVREYFARLNVSLVTASFESTGITQYYDLQTGKRAANYTPANPSAALGVYAAQLAKYPYVELGFDLPDPVPSELLLPFGDYAKKYNLGDLLGLLFQFAQGLGDLLSQPTLYVFKNFGIDLIRNLQTGFLTTAAQDNSLLYEHAATILGGQNVLLESTILAVDRSGHQVKVLIRTPGGIKLIKARKLVFTIPPKLENLRGGWDLSKSERKLFGKFGNSAYYTAIVKHTGLPENLTINNVSPDSPFSLPVLPGVYQINPTGVPGLFNVKFGSARDLPDSQVKEQIIASISNLQVEGKGPSNPEFVVYKSHTPFELTVSASAIADGFYRELYSLQGQRNTFYTGAAFHTHDSSLLWNFTETLLPSITAP